MENTLFKKIKAPKDYKIDKCYLTKKKVLILKLKKSNKVKT
jgi:hypothetical protein